MSTIVYFLCALTSLLCAGLLRRGYRRSGARLLFWSYLCFTFIALGNLMLIVDIKLLPGLDLSVWRIVPHLVGIAFLLYGLIWDSK